MQVSDEERIELVRVARLWIGTPYHHQAKLRGVGCDCLGLVRGVWEDFYGIGEPEKPPAYTPDWAEASGRETMMQAASRWLIVRTQNYALALGDVAIFRHEELSVAKHSAIYVGGGRMIHAVERRGVQEVHMGPWWQNKIAGVYTFKTRAVVCA